MLRFTALAPSILMVILLLTISRAMAEGPITVYTPKIPNERNSLVSTESVNVAPGRSEIRKFSDGFTSIHIGNPKVVDATPINDRSILLVGKEVGETDVVVLGDHSEPIAILSVSVAKSAATSAESSAIGSYVVIHDGGNSIADTTRYWCKEGVMCDRMN
jgi:Flp pilus assembly secretin CpaC